MGRAKTYTYAANGIDLLETRLVNGQTTELFSSRIYNFQHQPLTATDASGQTTTYTYNTQGQMLTVTTPARTGITENRTTTYSYDTNGYMQSVTAPATGATTSYTYDGYGRVRTGTDPDNYTVTYDYDALDRLTRVTYPDSTYEQVVYDRLDAAEKRDRLGRWTHTFYDALRRPVAVRDALGRTTTQQWCTCGSLDKVIDANNDATSWGRDVQGRMTSETRANGVSKQFVYENTTSRMKQVIDRAGQTQTYTYFLDDNLTQIAYSNAQNPTATVSFTYDPVYNRLATRTDGAGTTFLSYYPVTSPPTLGTLQLASEDGPLANDTITYSYDELGRAVTRQINGPANSLTQSFDELGRNTSESNVLGTFTLAYDGVTSRLSSLTYPNDQTTTYTYFGNSADRRLQTLHNKYPGSATLSKFDQTYDAVGNVASWSQQADTGSPKVFTFGYDAVNQVTSAVISGVTPLPVPSRFGYGYDQTSNRTAEQLDDAVASATHNNLNELVSTQPGGALLFRGTVNEPATVTVGGKPAQVNAANAFQGTATVPSGTSTVAVVATDASGNVRTNTYQVGESGASKLLTYDANGNLTGDGARTLSWDAENRLVAVDQGTHRSEFSYDGQGRRVRIIEKDNSVVTDDRRFLWCGEEICEERDGTGSNVTKRFFAWGVEQNGVSYYYAKDHLASIRELTDTSGVVRARYDYDPYGRVTKIAGDKDSQLLFTGFYFHAPTSLSLTLYRAYDGVLARWVSEDPSGRGDGPNLYAYVRNNPISRRDPKGLAGICFDNIVITAVLSCQVEVVDVQGSGMISVCPKGKAREKAAKTCEELKKKITEEGKSELYPVECPKGETCVNKKPVTTFQPPVDTVLTFSGDLGCKVTVKITGSFVGTGDIGQCCPKKGKCP